MLKIQEFLVPFSMSENSYEFQILALEGKII
jgi:hypothetical protein